MSNNVILFSITIYLGKEIILKKDSIPHEYMIIITRPQMKKKMESTNYLLKPLFSNESRPWSHPGKYFLEFPFQAFSKAGSSSNVRNTVKLIKLGEKNPSSKLF